MTAYHCELAWLGGEQAERGRPRHRRAVSASRRSKRRVADRPAGGDPAARPDRARPGQRPQPRLPPGPAGPHPARARAPSGRGGSRCTRSPPSSTPTRTTGWPGPPSPRWRWPASAWWASSTTSTTAPAASPTPIPTPWAAALMAAAAEAGIRITLLDTCYLQGGIGVDARRHAAPLRRRATPTPGPSGPPPWRTPCRRTARCPGRGGHPLGPGRRPAGHGDGGRLGRPPGRRRSTPTSPSSRPRTNSAPTAYGRTPTELLADHGVLGDRFTAVHATHLTRRRRGPAGRRHSAGAASARPPSGTWPTASARPGRCAGPAPGSRWAATPTP